MALEMSALETSHLVSILAAASASDVSMEKTATSDQVLDRVWETYCLSHRVKLECVSEGARDVRSARARTYRTVGIEKKYITHDR